MDYLTFKTEYPYRDTKRKIQNDLNKDIKELEYVIGYLEPKIKSNHYAWMYGVLHTISDLNQMKKELEFTKQLLKEQTR